ncbi:MAG: hypothetical protein H7138_08375 [Myxococcales bacterium]|nr:hypothetical protein [Myxococcales bacterium]
MVRSMAGVRDVLWVALAAVAIAAGCDSESMSDDPTVDPVTLPRIVSLSGRADLISGGDALIEIGLPTGATFSQLHVAVDGRDVTGAFAERKLGRIIGMVTGLADGRNVLSADVGTNRRVSLTLTNHKIGGPVISGAQVTPFECAVPSFDPAAPGVDPDTTVSGLSTRAIDDQCNIASEVTLFYRTSTPGCVPDRPDPSKPAVPPANTCFKPYDPAAAAPADLAMTTTTSGVTVPYIVRLERGTLNRGIYEIVVLFDAKTDDVKAGWKPYAPQPGWNGKVLYSFGASTGQPRRQFRSEQNWSDNDVALAGGFLVAVNSMTDSLFNSNRITMAETLLMMKEKISESYGEIQYVISNGCSGGSINQLTTASIFPGLLDGLLPTCTYPDSETTGIEVADCTLLVNFYNSAAWNTLMTGKSQAEINLKKAAINGHVDQTGCHAWVNSFSNISRPGNYIPIFVINNETGQTGPGDTKTRNNCKLPAALVYDPVANPTGVRCTGADHAVSILGKEPGTNHARDTRDNVGVQYGLQALVTGAITAEELVTLNEKIGGSDFDSAFTAARSEGDAEALAIVYRAGIVSDGKHLANVPIIDLRGYDDTNLSPPAPPRSGGIHHQWRSFALRARLDAANGGHGNHVMWRYNTSLFPPPDLNKQAFLAMDKWLSAKPPGSSAAQIIDRKPDEAHDLCFLSSNAPFTMPVTDAALCDADPLLKPHTSPRQVAGGPVAENILKCARRPFNRADYAQLGLSEAQLTRLATVFVDGVCDFTKPGIGQQPAVSPLDFSAGPGGVVLGDPPKLSAR